MKASAPTDPVAEHIRDHIDNMLGPIVASSLRKIRRELELLPKPAYRAYDRLKWWSLGYAVAGVVLILAGLLTGQHLALTVPGAIFAAPATAIFLFVAGCGHGYGRREFERDYIEINERREADLRSWLRLPRSPDGLGRIYVLQFSNYVVKVGQSSDFSRRLAEHRHAARTYDLRITKVWASQSHSTYLDNEVSLLAAVDQLHDAGTAKREYFHDAEFAAVVKLAEPLASGATVAPPLR